MKKVCIKSLYPPSFIVILALVTLASGCALHTSKLTEPVIDVPTIYSQTITDKTLPETGKWWEYFDDAQLNALIEAGLRNNLDIQQAAERIEQARSLLTITGSSRYPALTISGSGGRARQKTTAGAFTQDTYSLSAVASFEIDLWQKIRSRTDAALYDVQAEEENIKALYISIAAQIADLYYLASEQLSQLDLTDQTITSFKDTLDRVERRYREGLVPAIDVYQSRQNLASARAQRPLFESQLAVAVNALSVLTGRFPDKEIGHRIISLQENLSLPQGLPSELLLNRPDLQAALFRLRASDERIGAAIADRFPSFNLIGTYGGSSSELHSTLDSPNIFWNLLLQAAQPLFDAGRRKAEVERTKSVLRENLAAYHKTVLTAFQEVEDALVKIASSEERVTMLKETVDASDSALRLALNRYMQGLTDYLPVLTEQLRNATVKSNLLSVRRQLVSGRIELARALGGEWAQAAYKINFGEKDL
jgi:NodT family efflux transporter outer membrane factor (OMF) lipoprotein